MQASRAETEANETRMDYENKKGGCQLEVGFLEVTDYLEWLANIILVPKKDGKVRTCVAYRHLNRANPKDDFLLSHIDVPVDNAVGNSLFSFMDGSIGYNQIRRALED